MFYILTFVFLVGAVIYWVSKNWVLVSVWVSICLAATVAFIFFKSIRNISELLGHLAHNEWRTALEVRDSYNRENAVGREVQEGFLDYMLRAVVKNGLVDQRLRTETPRGESIPEEERVLEYKVTHKGVAWIDQHR